MGKIVATLNMSLDGYCDHDKMNADEELHDYYTQRLKESDLLLYGRITYKLMDEFWPGLVRNPSGDQSLDDFARAIDAIPKIVFSKSLQSVSWHSAQLKHEIVKEEIEELKNTYSGDICAGSPSIINTLSNLGLIDEYQMCIHPVILGSGKVLFNNIKERVDLELVDTKRLRGGAIILYHRCVV